MAQTVDDLAELEEKPRGNQRQRIGISLLITVIAVALLILHLLQKVKVDASALGLVALAVLPWLAVILETAELPGGWKVKFREVETEQRRLDREVQWLKFLMRNFLTQYELQHLHKFAAEGPFWFEFDSGTKTYFERELRRMLDMNLIERVPGTGVRGLLYDRNGIEQVEGKGMKDVKKYLRITAQGREYLQMRDQLTEQKPE
jgi:hypothetical protein